LQILHPCNINLVGSTPDGQGLHLDVCMTDIRLRVSPGMYKSPECSIKERLHLHSVCLVEHRYYLPLPLNTRYWSDSIRIGTVRR